MQQNRIKFGMSLVAGCLLTCLAASGARGDDVKGMIIARAGETLIVNGPNGKVTVVLTETTKTKDDTGLFGLGTDVMADTVLIPGLKVKVDGSPDGEGRVIAKTITVDGDDLETSQMIEAGLHPTAEQVAENVRAIEANRTNIGTNRQNIEANQKNIAYNKDNIAANKQRIEENVRDIEEHTNRFSALADYDVKASATVNFDVASTKISAKDQEELKNLAQTATATKGYIVEVAGYADSTGNAAMNTKLSEQRAKAVITFLMQQGGVPVRHIIAPGAMGEYGATATNETKAGRAENRRVEVKVLVNKGIAGS